jgi:hypothetical protein
MSGHCLVATIMQVPCRLCLKAEPPSQKPGKSASISHFCANVYESVLVLASHPTQA